MNLSTKILTASTVANLLSTAATLYFVEDKDNIDPLNIVVTPISLGLDLVAGIATVAKPESNITTGLKVLATAGNMASIGVEGSHLYINKELPGHEKVSDFIGNLIGYLPEAPGNDEHGAPLDATFGYQYFMSPLESLTDIAHGFFHPQAE